MKQVATTPSDYRIIAHYGRSMGSFPYYIEGQQEKALADSAPLTAVYHNGKRWVLATEYTGNPELMAEFFKVFSNEK